ncbi:MAG: response regulator [Planctomycetia bacterium]|nr:response regulator [Planctomycetia bacterium]
MSQFRSSYQGYLVAILATAVVVVAGGHVLGKNALLLFFVVPVVATRTGGLMAGLFGTLLSAVVGPYFFMDPTGLHISQTDQMRVATFVIVAGFMSWLVESLHVARRRVEDRQRQLEREAAGRMQMEKALQDADRRKDEFLATLAHELRNPLASLSYALQIWSPFEDDHAEMVQLRTLMERQVQQLTRLIDDLMDVSRITRGKIQLQKQRVQLDTLILGVVEAIQPLVETSAQQLTVTMPVEPTYVEGDVGRLTQVFGNILHNATKYTGRNGIIGIVAEKQGGKAVVKIRDNGPGIPKQMLADIFEMFRQVDQTLDRAHGGLGIGLTLVKRLVDVHGGSVEARSDGLGKGSEFIVTLPTVASESNGQPEGAGQKADQTVPRRKILVVDDVQASAQTLAMMLRAIGQEASVAHDGPAAIEWVIEKKPDVVFLDIAMPGMNGYEVARLLRARPDLRSLRLVALTGYGQVEDRRKAAEAGFDHHMTKPASVDALKEFLLSVPARGEEDASERWNLGSAMASG